MTWLVRLLGVSGFAIGAIWFADARRRNQDDGRPLGEVIQRDFRAFVTHRFNPLVMRLGLAGGRRSPWAIVEHVGRVTGTAYRSPMLPLTADDFVYVPLTYGANVHWVANIRAAGHCRIEHHEMILELDEPAIVTSNENPTVPRLLRGAAVRSGRKYLRLHVLERVPGTFVPRRPQQVVQPAAAYPGATNEVHAIPLNMVRPAAGNPRDPVWS